MLKAKTTISVSTHGNTATQRFGPFNSTQSCLDAFYRLLLVTLCCGGLALTPLGC